jgi:hypothetical protein
LKECEMWARAATLPCESTDRHDLGAFELQGPRHRAGQPARLTTCRTPSRLLISRNFDRVAAK